MDLTIAETGVDESDYGTFARMLDQFSHEEYFECFRNGVPTFPIKLSPSKTSWNNFTVPLPCIITLLIVQSCIKIHAIRLLHNGQVVELRRHDF